MAFTSISKALCLLAAALPALAATVPPTDSGAEPAPKQEQGVIQFPLEVEVEAEDVSSRGPAIDDLSRRQVPEAIRPWGNLDIAYTFSIHVGTPPQRVIVEPDTGSPTFWLPYVTDPKDWKNGSALFLWTDENKPTDPVGKQSYSGGESVTFVKTEQNMSLGPVDLGPVPVGLVDKNGKDVRLGSVRGVLGLSPQGGVLDVLERLISKGVCRSKVVSISLSPFRYNTGSITFGGVDTSQLQGKLEEFPLVDHSYKTPTPKPEPYVPKYTFESISYLRVRNETAETAKTTIDFLDTPISPITINPEGRVSFLPKDTVEKLANQFGGIVGGFTQGYEPQIKCEDVDAMGPKVGLEAEVTGINGNNSVLLSMRLQDFVSRRGDRCWLAAKYSTS
ncbi:eukaryotic aspartyl protease [Hirsutella rhossiliensis]